MDPFPLDNYIFVCSSEGDMYLKNINKVTLISSVNSVGGEEASGITRRIERSSDRSGPHLNGESIRVDRR